MYLVRDGLVVNFATEDVLKFNKDVLKFNKDVLKFNNAYNAPRGDVVEIFWAKQR